MRLAQTDERKKIQKFIKKYWSVSHILANNDDFFCYEFAHEKNINFIIRINNEKTAIDAICGFIKNTKEYKNTDAWGAVWKVVNSKQEPFLGIKIIKHLSENMGFRSFSGCGANEKTLEIYKRLGYVTGQLKHYYLLNEYKDEYRIAKIVRRNNKTKRIHNDAKLVLFQNYNDLLRMFPIKKYKKRIPYKDNWYLKRRYFEHPIYRYQIYGIQVKNEISSIIVTRVIECKQARVLRIVDFIGNESEICLIGKALHRLLLEMDLEYIDFYQHGISSLIMNNTVFTLRDKEDLNVIPNYFEPFEQKNIELNFFTNSKESIYIFKADGDQDRPSNW